MFLRNARFIVEIAIVLLAVAAMGFLVYLAIAADCVPIIGRTPDIIKPLQ